MIDFSDDITAYSDLSKENDLWVGKYRPKTLDDICLDEKLRSMFQAQIKTGNIQNITLVGPPGIGKTTLAMTLVEEIGGEPLFVSCASGDGRVDTIAAKIVPFCQYSSAGRKKVVILDELDSASAGQANSFQKALRNVIEEYGECRFIATANYKDNIIQPLLSRMPPVTISFNIKAISERLTKIMNAEHVSLGPNIPKTLISKGLARIIKDSYPDIRAIIGRMQMLCSDGKLKKETLEAIVAQNNVGDSYDIFYRDLLAVLPWDNPIGLRRLVNDKITTASANGLDPFGQLVDGYRFAKGLFDYLLNNGIKNIDALVELSAQLNTIETCIDKETQVFRFFLLLAKYGIH